MNIDVRFVGNEPVNRSFAALHSPADHRSGGRRTGAKPKGLGWRFSSGRPSAKADFRVMPTNPHGRSGITPRRSGQRIDKRYQYHGSILPIRQWGFSSSILSVGATCTIHVPSARRLCYEASVRFQ
jgi:hypothetical protein